MKVLPLAGAACAGPVPATTAANVAAIARMVLNGVVSGPSSAEQLGRGPAEYGSDDHEDGDDEDGDDDADDPEAAGGTGLGVASSGQTAEPGSASPESRRCAGPEHGQRDDR